MRDFILSLLVGFVGTAVTIAVAAVPIHTPAQDAPISREGLVLARVCAHEAGWDADATGDCAAIHEVLWRGAEREGLSYRAFAFAYSGRALRGETSRRYFAELSPSGERPASWPENVLTRRGDGTVGLARGPAWSTYREQWLELLAFAESIVHHPPEASSPCASPVHDWGGSMDAARAERIGLVGVDCGDTRNTFYARPWLLDGGNDPTIDVE